MNEIIDHDGKLAVEILTGGPFAENCYLATDPDSAKTLVIDPGHSAERILARIRERRLDVLAITNTHGHVDHVGAASPVKQGLGVPFWMHPGDRPVVESTPLQARMFGLPACEPPEIDAELSDDQRLEVGGITAQVLHTPGHTPGGSCLYFADAKVVFVGDTLFAGSIGRTDLPGGHHETLLGSIAKRLLSLPDDVVAYSGHGPPTTIGEERRFNPFLR